MEESISLKDYFLIDFDGLTKLHFFKLVNGGIWQSFIKYLKVCNIKQFITVYYRLYLLIVIYYCRNITLENLARFI